jgi:hypothetical protein
MVLNIFERPIPLQFEKIISVVKAGCSQSNWLHKTTQQLQAPRATSCEGVDLGRGMFGEWINVTQGTHARITSSTDIQMDHRET